VAVALEKVTRSEIGAKGREGSYGSSKGFPRRLARPGFGSKKLEGRNASHEGLILREEERGKYFRRGQGRRTNETAAHKKVRGRARTVLRLRGWLSPITQT